MKKWDVAKYISDGFYSLLLDKHIINYNTSNKSSVEYFTRCIILYNIPICPQCFLKLNSTGFMESHKLAVQI